MNWEECKKKRIVREVSPRREQIEFLLRSSKKRFISYEQLDINDDTAASKVGLLYDSLRMILEALAIEEGFKIYNHDCIACFLKEICGENVFSEIFDKYRLIRNGFNYYGEDVSVDDALKMIKELDDLRLKIVGKYFGGRDEN